MPLFRAYVVPALFGLGALALIGYSQTDRPWTEPATANEQTADTHPAAPGQDARSTGPPSTSESATKPESPQMGVKIGPLPLGHLAVPVFPAAPLDLPSGLTNHALQSGVPIDVLYEFLFDNMSMLDQLADRDDKAGKHEIAALWRTHDQRAAGLNDAEGQILRETALACMRALKEQDAKIRTFAKKQRAQSPPGVIGPIPPEFIQMVEDRKKIVSDHVEKLREALGDASFHKLDTYVHSSLSPQSISPKPAPARPSITTTGNNDRKDQ